MADCYEKRISRDRRSDMVWLFCFDDCSPYLQFARLSQFVALALHSLSGSPVCDSRAKMACMSLDVSVNQVRQSDLEAFLYVYGALNRAEF